MPENGRKWDRRIARARELAGTYPFAREILLFYSQLADFQKSSYLAYPPASFSGSHGRDSLPATLDEIEQLLLRWRPFLSLLEAQAPGPLAEFARKFKANDVAAASALLRAAWPRTGDPLFDNSTVSPLKRVSGCDNSALSPLGERRGEGAFSSPRRTGEGVPTILAEDRAQSADYERFCTYAFLQPFAEFLADHADTPRPEVRLSTCPYCGSPPLVGVLRPEGEGAKRSLICAFCRTEWDYLRIACPACNERREENLCVYSTPKFEGVRVEACETCKAYIKTVDLAHNGLAVPEVDDLAAVPLDLWAVENGYHRATRNLLYF